MDADVMFLVFFPLPVIFCISDVALSVTLCNVVAMLLNSLIKGLPDNDVASPAVRRACQPAGRIEVNKPKCMYMLRDRLLSEQQGSNGTDLLRFVASLNSPVSMTVRVLSRQAYSFKKNRTCACAYEW